MTRRAGPALSAWLVASVFGSAFASLIAAAGVTTNAAPPQTQTLRPFADYEDTGYVFMSAHDGFGADALKHAIAEHLPTNVTLVLYGTFTDFKARDRALTSYSRFIPADRLVYLSVRRNKNTLWSRDAIPVPLLDAGQLALTDAKYWAGFEPDADVAALFGARLIAHPFRFEGGNFMANHLGDCFIVESRETKKMADALFSSAYGCRHVTRLPRRGGVGHIDERARFVNATTILTDTPDYADPFAAGGFTVVRLPRPKNDRETYVNALLVNGTAFVPQFDRADDAAALAVYRQLGFRTIGLPARSLAAKGLGLLHCLTMNYPRVPLANGAGW